MIADGVPQVAEARRLGHILPDKIENVYSRVAPAVEVGLLDGLQQRWTNAVNALALTNNSPEHRQDPTPGAAHSWITATRVIDIRRGELPAGPSAIAG
ncbi:hypothetical protein [Pseudonocardia spinosispora]|uniref:hypothetical protein n=1 Tax=Pseudonocardia spinosispora TaxID=103441 RepID=UPI0012EC478C|nr:hypothetical protein [Pseudonocardia spinosispora]